MSSDIRVGEVFLKGPLWIRLFLLEEAKPIG